MNSKILTKGRFLMNKDEVSIGGRIFRFEGSRSTPSPCLPLTSQRERSRAWLTPMAADDDNENVAAEEAPVTKKATPKKATPKKVPYIFEAPGNLGSLALADTPCLCLLSPGHPKQGPREQGAE